MNELNAQAKMALTTLDPNAALIVIDLQKGITSMPTVHPVSTVIANAAKLADAFRNDKKPVVLVNVSGGAPGRVEAPRPTGSRPADWTELVPELNLQPTDHRVTKQRWGAFSVEGLSEYLSSRGVTQVVICGIATSMGVESTARQAHELGFNVTLAIDAMTDRDPSVHDNSVKNIFPKLGERGTTEEIVSLLR